MALSVLALLVGATSAMAPNASAGLQDQSLVDESQLPPHGLNPGAFSLSSLFPSEGLVAGSTSIGLKSVISREWSIEALIQAGYDRGENRSVFGLTLKGLRYLHTNSRAIPYLFADVSVGQNGGDAMRHTGELQTAAGVGIGGEVFILPEFSVGVETGIGAQFLPLSHLVVGTGSSRLRLNFYFEL